LIRQPTQRFKRDHSRGANHYHSFQTMANARESTLSAIHADAIVENQVPAINMRFDSVPEKRHYSMGRNNCCGIEVLRRLMYGLRSCHWELIPPLVVRGAPGAPTPDTPREEYQLEPRNCRHLN
jgi:hypothetical protein